MRHIIITVPNGDKIQKLSVSKIAIDLSLKVNISVNLNKIKKKRKIYNCNILFSHITMKKNNGNQREIRQIDRCMSFGGGQSKKNVVPY